MTCTTQILVVLLIGCATREFSFNQLEALQRSGYCTSTVWNFCAHYSDIVLRGLKWRPCVTSGVFSGYCRVGFKKPGNVSVHLAETVGTTIKAFGVNYVDLKVLGEEPRGKPPKPMNAFDFLTKAASMKILPLEVKTDDENHTQ